MFLSANRRPLRPEHALARHRPAPPASPRRQQLVELLRRARRRTRGGTGRALQVTAHAAQELTHILLELARAVAIGPGSLVAGRRAVLPRGGRAARHLRLTSLAGDI